VPSPPARVPWFCEQHAYEIDSFLVLVVVKNVLKRNKKNVLMPRIFFSSQLNDQANKLGCLSRGKPVR